MTGRVVIIGGGLGGLAAGVAARHAGFEVVVVERAPGLSEVDTGITLWRFALTALQQLDVPLPSGAAFDRLVNLSSDGRLLSDVRLPTDPRAPAPAVDVHRGELQEALATALGRHHIRFGRRCNTVREHGHQVVAVLDDGSEVPGDILVGADGVHSCVRSHVAGPVPARNASLGVWRGVLPLDPRLAPQGVHVRVYGRGVVAGLARLDDERMRWYIGGRSPRAVSDPRETLKTLVDGWSDPVDSVVRAAELSESVLYNDTPRISRLPAWVRGRTALLGDAAHAAVPTLGISGGLALADGVALGEALRRHGSGPGALQAYAAARQPVGRRIQREAETVGQIIGSRRPAVAWARELGLASPFIRTQRRALEHLIVGGQFGRQREPARS